MAALYGALGHATATCGCLLVLVAGEAAAAIPASERKALIALYDSTNGSRWEIRDNWRNAADTDFSPPGTECRWYGVTCDTPGQHVLALDLPYNDLNGRIPSEIGDLAYLERLALGWNLTEPIPPEILTLTSLTHLELYGFGFEGLSASQVVLLTNLTRLTQLGLETVATIPPEIGRLTRLSGLGLGVAGGSIPPEIGSLPSLEYLYLIGQLDGSIPPEIGNLTSLVDLTIHGLTLGGSIPPDIGRLRHLKSLDLSISRLSGSIPSEIANLGDLETLSLDQNQLTGPIPAELGTLSNLRSLSLEDNQFTGPIPPKIGLLSSLGNLELRGNQLTGAIPSEFGNLASLFRLDLVGNQLSGPIPPEIGNLRQLYYLYLDDNQLSGSIPPQIGTLTALAELFVRRNRLSGPIPKEIGGLTNLRSVSLEDNQLSGPIPAEIGKLSKLMDLQLRGNQLTGAIPPQIGNLANLLTLDLVGNQLSGTIPPQIANLGQLYNLYLDDNQLSGSIPPQIGNLTRLGDLTLQRNALSGQVPAEIARLTWLRTLYLNGNRLSGPLPSALADTEYAFGFTLDLRWNAVYTDDPALRSFLDSKQLGGDWESTQTIAPTGLAPGIPTENSVLLSWTPILYHRDDGAYRVWYGTTAGGPYELYGTLPGKASDAWVITGLSPMTHYSFVLQTVTDPHADNPNTVVSELSAEATAITGTAGLVWHRLTVHREGPGRVSSSPDGILCGGVCSAAYAPGTLVTLTAVADGDAAFDGWRGACSGPPPTCVVTMDSAQAVTATFSPPATAFYTVTPCRAYDSRSAGLGGSGPLDAGTDNAVVVGGTCGIPATAKAVALNVTVVSPTVGGHLRLYPSGTARTDTSSINYAPGQTRANNAVVPLGADGAIAVHVHQQSGTVHVVLDVSGYFQ